MNICTFIGRLAATPELKSTTSGNSVTSFSIAVDRKYTPKGEERKCDFINIVAWRSTAEFICKYFEKGQMIAITGELQTRNYDDKNGNKRIATEIVANQVDFCGSKSTSGNKPAATKPITEQTIDIDEDDLPF